MSDFDAQKVAVTKAMRSLQCADNILQFGSTNTIAATHIYDAIDELCQAVGLEYPRVACEATRGDEVTR